MGEVGMDMSSIMARSYTNLNARLYGREIGSSVTVTRTLSLFGGGSYTRGAATPVMQDNVMSSNLPLRAWISLRHTRRWLFAEAGTIAEDRQSKVDTDLQEIPTAGDALLKGKLGFTWLRLTALPPSCWPVRLPPRPKRLWPATHGHGHRPDHVT